MKVVYIAGPFTAETTWKREQNIRRAEELALRIWLTGKAAAICPHTMCRFFDGEAPASLWYKGDLEIVKRCDAVMVVPSFKYSQGTHLEIELGKKIDIPIFYNVAELEAWLEEKK